MLLSPQIIAFNPVSTKAYAADRRHAAVSVYVPAQNGTSNVPVQGAPNAIALNSRTNRVYVASSGTGIVSVLDGDSDRVVTTVKAGPHPYVLAVDEAKDRVYVTNTFSDLVGIIDGKTNAVRTVKLGSADSIAVDARTHRVFLLSYESQHLSMWDGESETATKIQIGEHSWGLAIDQSAHVVYVTRVGAAELVAYHEDSGSVQRVPVGAIPAALAIDEYAHRIFTADYGSDTVTVVEGRSMRVVRTIKAPTRPQTIAVGPSGRVYVGSSHASGISVLDAELGIVKRIVANDVVPFAMIPGHKETVLFVANSSDPVLLRVWLEDLRA